MKPASFEATPPMLFHQLFRQGKLEANRKQNYIYKTKFHCPPRTENQIISVKPSFTVCPARSVSLALLGGCISLRSEDTLHSARRVHLALLEECRSLCSKCVARPARRMPLVLLGGCRSPCSERIARPARSVSLASLEACHSPCSKDAARPARSDAPMLFHQVFRQGKLEANRKQNYIYKTKFHCSPRTENQIISVKPSFTVRPARRVPFQKS